MAVDVRQRRREQTRRDILAAAWRLAERDGIAGLSLRDLAREVGMRAPSLYTYFDSKDDIYDAMFAEGYAELEEFTAELALDPDDPVGTLTAAIERFLAFCQASLARYQLLFTRVIGGWEPSPQAYAASVRTYDTMIAAFAALGIDDPAALDLFTAVTSGMAAQQIANDPGGDRWVRLAQDAAEMFLAHLERQGPLT